MRISTFPTLHEAFDSIVPVDTEYRLIIHHLAAGRVIPRHFHSVAHEWVVIDSGGEVAVFDGEQTVSLILRQRTVTVIHFPPNIIHGLQTKTPLKYFVIRDTADPTHYLDSDDCSQTH